MSPAPTMVSTVPWVTASVEGPTRANLAAAGFPVDTTTTDVVLTKGERPEWKGDNKTPRRQEVASHYRILLLIGDNVGDFVAFDIPLLDPWEPSPHEDR